MILLGHGAGGRLTRKLVEEHILPGLNNPVLAQLEDSAVMGDIALTIDAYVVTPRFFPGGDLGRLAISGTVNDLWMVGAEPLGISAALIMEEGLPLDELDRIVESMARTAREAGVQVVAGDTKVVARGSCDGAFITTAGVGRIREGFRPSPSRVRPGDAVLLSGSVADHGIAVMSAREGINLKGDIASDVAPLGGLVRELRRSGLDVHALRDPTRGGVAQSLIEISSTARARILLDEVSIPIKPAVRAACELLGLDPLYVANEGKLLLLLPADQAADALRVLRAEPLGESAAIVGKVLEAEPGVDLRTAVGGLRALRMHSAELLPRIC
jgi:hydrogenase expression/formation protein HypE